jgi:hypothetical protein
MMNFHDFLNRQKTEDRRAFIVHYPAKSSKTQFARHAVKTHPDIYYLDLQQYFLDRPQSSDQFGFSELKSVLLNLNVSESVLLVDNPDFLFNTWTKRDQADFANWLKIQLRSPGVTKKTFVFFVQNDPYFENMDLKNSQGESRVLPLNAFESL